MYRRFVAVVFRRHEPPFASADRPAAQETPEADRGRRRRQAFQEAGALTGGGSVEISNCLQQQSFDTTSNLRLLVSATVAGS